MAVITTAATYLDRILIFHYLGTVQVAIYSVAIAFPEQMKAVLKIVQTLVLPKFSRRNKEEVKKSVRIYSWKLGLAILMAILLYLVGAPYIFDLFFPNYTDSVFYSQLFALSLLTSVAILPNAALQSQMAQKELYLCNTLTSLLQIALLFGLTRTFGLTGVIAARVIGRFVNMFYMFILVKQM
jgi:O-antigen/teichoic acid export membrane protein